MKKLLQEAASISAADYYYDLPGDRIAVYPLKARDQARLLVYRDGNIADAAFDALPSLLDPGSLMLFNDTRVVQARLEFFKPGGARIEIFCLNPIAPHTDVQQALAHKGEQSWTALVGNAKKWKSGPLEITDADNDFSLKAYLKGRSGDALVVSFDWQPCHLSFGEVLEMAGKTPLPPYITRAAEDGDKSTYQCVFARNEGSVAAPTAGLHFTPATMNALHTRGVKTDFLTLHVGAGTFKPVSAETIAGHNMHEEQFAVDKRILQAILDQINTNSGDDNVGQLDDETAAPGRPPIIAVGTTSMRTLESLYWIGAQILAGVEPKNDLTSLSQWVPYEWEGPLPAAKEAIKALLHWAVSKNIDQVKGHTSLIIIPGYDFRLIDVLVTNFHLPKSTLLLLVAAFAGPGWKTVYQHALNNDYRFLSYGDACLFFRNKHNDETG